MENSGIFRRYYKDNLNNDCLEEEFFHIDGKKHGLYTRYDYLGNKIRTIEYVNGEKHGEYIDYHTFSNVIHYKCHFNNDIKVGEAIFYHPNGQIANICNYKDGKIEGMRYWYFENDDNTPGNLKQTCYHVDGLRQGKLINYNRDGSIKSIWNYVDDVVVH